jgi:hypothetical protein
MNLQSLLPTEKLAMILRTVPVDPTRIQMQLAMFKDHSRDCYSETIAADRHVVAARNHNQHNS